MSAYLTARGEEMLNAEEKRAIEYLGRLGNRWPRTLTLFSWSGSLVVFRSDEMQRVQDEFANDFPVAHVSGIPNDGGDP